MLQLLPWHGPRPRSCARPVMEQGQLLSPVDRRLDQSSETHRVATTGTAAATAGRTATATRGPTALSTLAVSAFSLFICLGLAGKLDRDLALKYLLAGQLGDRPLGLTRGGKVDKGIPNRAVGARVLGNGDGLANIAHVSALLDLLDDAVMPSPVKRIGDPDRPGTLTQGNP